MADLIGKVRRVAIFGGTFNPPHNGHVRMLQAVATAAWADKTIVIPAGNPPHKTALYRLPATYRLAMSRLAFSSLAEVSPCEVEREGKSFTIDTLKLIQEQYAPNGEPPEMGLVIGADSLVELPTWYKARDIMAMATLLVIRRPGISETKLKEAADGLKREYGAKIILIDCPETDVSSTKLRDTLQAILAKPQNVPTGLPETIPDNLRSLPIPPEVLRFILTNGLYAYYDLFDGFSPDAYFECVDIERKLRRRLTAVRLIHSLNVYCLALAMANANAINKDEAGLAAILHDCAKQMSRSDCLRLCPELLAKEADYPFPIWHSDVGAVVAANDFGITSPSVINAIRFHTTLHAGATKLEELVFVADKLEPSRTYTDLSELRHKLSRDVEEAAYFTALTIAKKQPELGQKVDSNMLAFLSEKAKKYPLKA